MSARAPVLRSLPLFPVPILFLLLILLWALLMASPLWVAQAQAKDEESESLAPELPVIRTDTSSLSDRPDVHASSTPVSTATIRVLQKPPYVPLQLVTIEVRLETQSLVVGPVEVKYPALEGATWIDASRATINGTRQERGKRLTVLSSMIGLFLRDSGALEIPSLALQVPVLKDGVRVGLMASTAPLSLDVVVPELLKGVAYVPASSIQMTSSLIGASEEHSVGQVVEQQVFIEAEGVLSVAFPDWMVPARVGLQSQMLPPVSNTSASRGAVTAQLDFRVRHVLEQTGRYSLDTYGIYWWDTERHRLKRIESEPVELEVLDTPPESGWGRRTLELIVLLMGLLLLGFGCWRLGARGKTIWKQLSKPVLNERLNP